jgi:protein O-GlcNAc transferase
MQNIIANASQERRLLQAGLVALEHGNLLELHSLLATPTSNALDEQDAHLLKGILATTERKPKEAIDHFSAVLRLDPNNLVAWFNLGQILLNLADHPRALKCFNEVYKRDANNIEALYLRCICHRALGDHANAGRDATEVVHRNPQHIGALKEVGNSLLMAGKFELARNTFRSVNQLSPNEPFVPCMIQFLSHQMCDWTPQQFSPLNNREISTSSTGLDILKQRCLNNEPGLEPFASLVMYDDPALHQQAALVWMNKLHPDMPTEVLARLEAEKRARPQRSSDQPLKIAYISSDFYEHATAYLMAGLLEQHNKQSVEVYCLSYGLPHEDNVRKRLEKAADHFIDINNMPDWQVARWCRENDIDIAIDLKGLTRDSRPDIFTHRAAPVQVNWLGYPSTMATGSHDYIIADATLISEEQKAHTTETLVIMPHSYQVNDSQRPKPQSTSRRENGLPDDALVMCCFNNHFKITAPIFNAWIKVLKATPNAVLWLLAGLKETETNLKNLAKAAGVQTDRIIFAPVLPLQQHISRLALADISLDTLPYNAHTTASDALWAGVPHLALQGKSFAARVSSSLLTAINMPELITKNLEDYQTLLQQLADQPKKLEALRKKLKTQHRASPLSDSGLFAKNLENAYRQMYQIWADQKPRKTLVIS